MESVSYSGSSSIGGIGTPAFGSAAYSAKSGIFAESIAPEIAIALVGGSELANAAVIDCGGLLVGRTVTKDFTLKNLGTAPLTGVQVSWEGAPGDFQILQVPSSDTVAVGGTTGFTVTFTPTTDGPQTATLKITSNDADEDAFYLDFTANGIALPVLAFTQTVYSAHQGDTVVDLTVARTGGPPATTVTLQTDDGTGSAVPPFSKAVAGTDYTDLTGSQTTLAFAEGEASKTVHITLAPKTGAQPNKRFTATLSAPTDGAILGGIATTTVEILAADSVKPTLTLTAPAAGAVSTLAPLTVRGVAGDAKGIERVDVVLNGGPIVHAALGSAAAPTSVPFSAEITPLAGTNTLVVTAYDLRGNSYALTRFFAFTRRYAVALTRTVPNGVAVDAAGTVTLACTPASAASALAPTTANSNPKTSEVLAGPNTKLTLTAAAKTGYVFSHWNGLPETGVELGNVATFTMPAENVAIEAVFIANPFIGAPGTGNTFFGLIHASDGTPVSNATEGFLTATLTATNGGLSGKLFIGGLAQAFTATLYGEGFAIFNVGAKKQTSLIFGARSLTLSYNAGEGNDQLTATVTETSHISTGTAWRAIYSAAHKAPAALLNSAASGFYTFGLPSKAQTPAMAPSLYPQGHGFGTLTLTNLGVVTVAGTLADGSAITASSGVITGDASPFFAQLVTPGAAAANKGGSFGGTLAFAVTDDSDVTGEDLLWLRPGVLAVTSPAAAAAATNLYTNGWSSGLKLDAVGALYSSKINVQTTLNLGDKNLTTGNARLAFASDKLDGDVVKTKFNIVTNAVTKIPAADATYTLTLAAATGGFSGTFTPDWLTPAGAKPAFKGILIQKGANKGGYGFFISNALSDPDPESGDVSLGKPQN